jgi:hypothetical protein
MRESCSTHGGEEEFMLSFDGKARRKDITMKTDEGGTIILKWILEK